MEDEQEALYWQFQSRQRHLEEEEESLLIRQRKLETEQEAYHFFCREENSLLERDGELMGYNQDFQELSVMFDECAERRKQELLREEAQLQEAFHILRNRQREAEEAFREAKTGEKLWEVW